MPREDLMRDADAASGRRFLADECTFTNTVRLMRDRGCAGVRIQEVGMAGASDAAVYQRAQENEEVLVTTDQGFGDVRTHPPSEHHGIIVLKMRPDPVSVQAVHRMLKQLLAAEDAFEKTLFIVDPHKYRKRRAS
jgi:predicted nuclease of predicted toxin-antitoxin system